LKYFFVCEEEKLYLRRFKKSLLLMCCSYPFTNWNDFCRPLWEDWKLVHINLCS